MDIKNIKNIKMGDKPNIPMKSQPNMPFVRFANSDTTTPKKLQSLGNKNRSVPPISGSSFSNENEEVQEEKSELKQKVDQVETKVASKAITAATKGVVKGEVADALAEKLIEQQKKKWKIRIILYSSGFLLLFLLIFGAFIGVADNSDMGKSTNSYISGEMSEDELIKQLEYYGYCSSESDCKKKGIYKFFEKLKDTYTEYSKSCDSSVKNNKPCGVKINTALILETINYYQNSGDSFNSNNTDVTEEDVTNSGFSIEGMFNSIVSKFKEQKEINDMLDQVDNLALAQSEYVSDSCGNKYYQISFNKYVSYLKYGDSSSHPNYSGNAVSKDNCSGPTNDYIGTSYSENNGEQNAPSATNGSKGEQIVQYALQFVGNPYVFGGTSLTNGIDCSGFTMKVFENFGISLPHNSTSQFSAPGAKVISTSLNDLSGALPGDILVWDGHVAIYMGNNQMVHAQSKKTGIVVSKISSSHTFKGVVRYWSES